MNKVKIVTHKVSKADNQETITVKVIRIGGSPEIRILASTLEECNLIEKRYKSWLWFLYKHQYIVS